MCGVEISAIFELIDFAFSLHVVIAFWWWVKVGFSWQQKGKLRWQQIVKSECKEFNDLYFNLMKIFGKNLVKSLHIGVIY